MGKSKPGMTRSDTEPSGRYTAIAAMSAIVTLKAPSAGATSHGELRVQGPKEVR